jgi:zinc/manganese transport system substrate-binding protein/manganese/iron transport system substrate-binding protein
MTSRVVGPLVVLALLAGCGPAAQSPDSGRLEVVATTTVLADLVAQVGGDSVSVTSLVPKGGEVHTFDPSPGDVGRVAAADLVVVNGLGLDDWAVGLARDSGTSARILMLADSIPAEHYIVDEETGRPNPHLWLDPSLAAGYARAIGQAIGTPDRAETYVEELTALEGETRATIGALPADARRIVSFHDALPYFARAFDLEIVGVVVDAPGQDPSAGEIAELIDAIKASGVKAILSEAQFPHDLADTVAGETGATVVADLYTDTLGDPPVDTYGGMIRWDVDRIVEALG